jgi:hypothetical protein
MLTDGIALTVLFLGVVLGGETLVWSHHEWASAEFFWGGIWLLVLPSLGLMLYNRGQEKDMSS